MSYVLQIWSQPADEPPPTTVAEADALVVRLSKTPQPQDHPLFLQLAQRLTQRYPCLTTLDEEDEESEDATVWSDGPLDGRTACALYGLGVQTTHLHRAVPFVVATARALGLNVYDMQAGEAHLANGSVLHLRHRAPIDWEAQEQESEDIETCGEAQRLLRAAMTPFFEQAGYKPGEKGRIYTRKKGKIRQIISLYADGAIGSEYARYGYMGWLAVELIFKEGLDLYLSKYAGKSHENISEISLRFQHKLMFAEQAAKKIPHIQMRRFDEGKFYFEGRSSVAGVAQAMNTYLHDYIFPLLDDCISIEDIHRHFNPADHPNHFNLKIDPSCIVTNHIGLLTIAYLVDHARFEDHIKGVMGHRGYEHEPLQNFLTALPDGERWLTVMKQNS
ncbi:MAG: hypothetical protein Q4G70_04300 [Pseudomonadota bacterium]|nr:hypothetical protein [Pseudomonadota bacterium]